jgi:amino acid transporter
MIAVFPLLYVGYKFTRKTKIWKPEEVDLVKDKAEIDEYERNYIPQKAG